MTRCWPVNGRFTEPQKVVYEALLDVQLDLIKFCEELPPLDVLFQKMCYLLGRNLKELGFGNSKCNSINDKAQVTFILFYILKCVVVPKVLYYAFRWLIRFVLITSVTIWVSTSMILGK